MAKPTYWAHEPVDKIGKTIADDWKSWDMYLHTAGWYTLWQNLHYSYYKGWFYGAKIRLDGEQGERRLVEDNQFKSILQHINIYTTSNRPAGRPVASNNDYKSEAQVKVATNLLEYILKVKHLDWIYNSAVESATRYGEGWGTALWDAGIGETVVADPETGDEAKSGDLKMAYHYPWNVRRDVKSIYEEGPWKACRMIVNRWSTAGRYPEFRDAIEAMPFTVTTNARILFSQVDFLTEKKNDQVWIYYLWHEPTVDMPEGLQVISFEDGTVVYHGKLPYRTLPIFPVRPEKRDNSAFGHSVSFDLAPLQEALDNVFSQVSTNIAINGLPNVIVEGGIEIVDAPKGGRIFEKPKGSEDPKALNLLDISPALFSYMDLVRNHMELNSGVNDVARGDVNRQMSGKAIDSIESMTLRFTSNLQASAASFLESIMMQILNCYQDYCEYPIVYAIAGKSNEAYMAEFSRDQISDIQRYTVELVDPFTGTAQGKMMRADNMMQHGLITTPEQYAQLVETGRLEKITDGPSMQMALIDKENEMMMNGELPTVAIDDDDVLHLRGHGKNSANPDIRNDANLMAVLAQHNQMHLDNWLSKPVELLSALGQQPPPIPPPMPIGPGMPPMPPEGLPPGPPPDAMPPMGGAANELA